MKKYSSWLLIPPLVISITAIAGWVFNLPFLNYPIAGVIAINPITALCILLLATASLLIVLADKPSALTKIISVLVVMCGAIKLLSLVGIETGIDEILFARQIAIENAKGILTRMAPNSALSILLSGLALLLIQFKNDWLRRLTNYVVVVIFIVALFSLLGFIYKVEEFYGVISYIPMSLQSAIAFLCLSLAILFYNSDYGFMQVISSPYLGGSISRILFPSVLIIPITLGFLRLYLSWKIQISAEFGVTILVTSIIIFLLSIVWYISRELNRSDRERGEGENRFQKMIAEVQDYAIIMLDAGGNVLSWNSGAEKIKGYKKEEVLGANFKIFYTWEDIKEDVPQKLLTAAKEKGRVATEGWRITKSGKQFWASVVITALNGQDGEIFGYTKVTRDLTEKRKTEEALLRQVELFKIMPDAVVYGVAPDEKTLVVTGMNDAAKTLLEISDSIIGRTTADITNIEIIGGLTREDARRNLFANEGTWRGELVRTNSTGQQVNLLVTLKSLGSYGQGPKGWLAMYTDITLLKMAEKRLAHALDGMQAGLWEWKFTNRAENWFSPRYNELLGYAPYELEPTTETLRELFHPDDWAHMEAIFRQKVVEGGPVETEARYKIKSGVYRWFSVIGKTEQDSTGKPISIIGSIIDIDDKKKAELEVRRQTELIQMMPDGIFYGDDKNNLLGMNEGAMKMLEVGPEEFKGKTIDAFVTLETVGKKREELSRELASTGFTRGELKITTRSGKQHLVLCTVKRTENTGYGTSGWVCVYTDIAPLKLNEELTAALKIKEENNKYLEQLAYIGAHDLKSPIVSIIGLVNVASKNYEKKQNFDVILKMLRNTAVQMQRSNNALNEILRLRKSLPGYSEIPDLKTSTLAEIIEETKIVIDSELLNNGGRLNIDIEKAAQIRLPYFHCKSILYNLLNNAIKYADPLRVLQINLSAIIDKNGTLVITVSDNGIGMLVPDNKDKIYGMFKRMHSHVEGTGVGLHIVKSIIDAYGGEIDVESTEGEGTTFKILFNKSVTDQWN